MTVVHYHVCAESLVEDHRGEVSCPASPNNFWTDPIDGSVVEVIARSSHPDDDVIIVSMLPEDDCM